jgi:hypothetical protein
MKGEWNRMWLRMQVIRERRDVYFMCRDRGWNCAQTQAAFNDIGLGKLPAYMDSWGEDPMGDAWQGPPEHDFTSEMRSASAADEGSDGVEGGEGGEGSEEGEGNDD